MSRLALLPRRPFHVALAAFSGARLFGGGWLEMAVSGFASLLIGGLDLLSKRRPAVGRVLVPAPVRRSSISMK